MKFLNFEGMTRFERARIISARALQIAMGAPVLVKGEDGKNPIDLAREEFEEGVVPLTVKIEGPAKVGE